jgi:hypothetical protein
LGGTISEFALLLLLLLPMLLQYGASCGDLKGGCDAACRQGALGTLMWYLPNSTPYYSQLISESRLETASSSETHNIWCRLLHHAKRCSSADMTQLQAAAVTLARTVFKQQYETTLSLQNDAALACRRTRRANRGAFCTRQ